MIFFNRIDAKFLCHYDAHNASFGYSCVDSTVFDSFIMVHETYLFKTLRIFMNRWTVSTTLPPTRYTVSLLQTHLHLGSWKHSETMCNTTHLSWRVIWAVHTSWLILLYTKDCMDRQVSYHTLCLLCCMIRPSHCRFCQSPILSKWMFCTYRSIHNSRIVH